MNEVQKIKVGTIGFGQIGGYPPARWRFIGVINGSVIVEHVKHRSQSVGFPPQGISWDELNRIMAR
jgi:hypothetical protein